MHLFIVFKVIQERIFCKYAYVTWLDVSYPFNGYCAPIENARVFIEMCNLCS